MASNKKVKWDRVVIIILAIIGALCILDNGWRLTKEIGSSIYHAVSHHSWNTVVIK